MCVWLLGFEVRTAVLIGIGLCGLVLVVEALKARMKKRSTP